MTERIRVLSKAESDHVSLTKQADALDSDVNRIVSRYVQTGVWTRNGQVPMYGDFSNVPDLRECLDRIREMEEDYVHLPVEVRRASSNDPTEFLLMLQDPERRKVLEEAGYQVSRHGPAKPVEPSEPGSSSSSNEA